jgi:hypothetical protein
VLVTVLREKWKTEKKREGERNKEVRGEGLEARGKK